MYFDLKIINFFFFSCRALHISAIIISFSVVGPSISIDTIVWLGPDKGLFMHSPCLVGFAVGNCVSSLFVDRSSTVISSHAPQKKKKNYN